MHESGGRPTFKTVAVGAADKVLVAANPRRRGIILTNCDLASTVYLAPNQPAVIGQGYALGPVYDSLELTGNDWGLLPAAEWHAIALLTGAAQGPQAPFSASAFHSSVVNPVVNTSFTVPAGSAGTLMGATYALHTGAGATVQLQLLRGGNAFVLLQTTGASTYTIPIALQAGDTVQWATTIGSAGQDSDFTLGGWTVTAAGAAPSAAQVGVIELEG